MPVILSEVTLQSTKDDWKLSIRFKAQETEYN